MDAPRWLTADEERAWRGYRRMRTLLDLQLGRDLAREGLSESDYDVLSTLSEAEGDRWRVNEFARRLLWDQSRLSHQLSRMERRGLVAREECAGDGRGSFVVLTDAGRRALVTAAPKHVSSVRAHLIDLLAADQIVALDAIAQTVIDHLTREGREQAKRRYVADTLVDGAPRLGGDEEPG